VAGPAGVTSPPGLCVSFQRYPWPASGAAAPAAPSSLGALPLAEAHGELLLPVAIGEAFWIGLDLPADAPGLLFLLRVQTSDGAWWPQAPLRVAPHAAMAGYAAGRPDRRAFGAGCSRLAWALEQGGVTLSPLEIRLVDPAEYARRSGQPAPPALQPGSGFGGWRLP